MKENARHVIRARNLKKIYRRGSEEIYAVNEVSLDVKEGEFISVVGPSGSGKTTLINILGCLENPSSGQLELDGRKIFDEGRFLSEGELTQIRRELFGYVFQKFYLIPTLTVVENVMLPYTFYRKPGAEERVQEILKLLGMEHRRHHLPGQISGGEMQRVAIARALVNEPRILMADEPTGNLDTKRRAEIGEILRELNGKKGLTIILVTHNAELAAISQRAIELRDGKIYEGPDQPPPDSDSR
ncbi:MAG: ABC transporter ATP-binding protein [candidate division NC10 bacterium]|nr:ABC transporter ATP-binding protein [candidate division NC10 bacterium]